MILENSAHSRAKTLGRVRKSSLKFIVVRCKDINTINMINPKKYIYINININVKSHITCGNVDSMSVIIYQYVAQISLSTCILYKKVGIESNYLKVHPVILVNDSKEDTNENIIA